jgi:hypothetical protein
MEVANEPSNYLFPNALREKKVTIVDAQGDLMSPTFIACLCD